MTTWPANDLILMLLAKYIGLEEAYAKLERAAIADNPCVGMVSKSYSEDEYAGALIAWRPESEPMPVRGYP